MTVPSDGLRDHGIVSMLRAGLDTPEQRREMVPATVLLLLAWLGFLAWIGPFVRSPVASLLLDIVPRNALTWGIGTILALGAAIAYLAGRRGLATLAAILLAYHVGTGLIGVAYGSTAAWRAGFSESWWAAFSLRRVLYGVATCLPLLVVSLLLFGREALAPFRIGTWSATTRISRKDVPASWTRTLGGLALVAGLPTLVLMQLTVGFEPIVGGRIITLLIPILVVSAVNASVEEAIFRGFALPAAVVAVGVPRGMWLVGLWFGLHHFGLSVAPLASFPSALLLGIGSVVFAKSVLETRGIAWAIAAHGVFDIAIFSAYYGRI